MLLEIFCLIIKDIDPKELFEVNMNLKSSKTSMSKTSSKTSSKPSSSRLHSLLQSEIQKDRFYTSQLPSSFSDSYNITSVNRFISTNHKIDSYLYKPRTVVSYFFSTFLIISIFHVGQRISHSVLKSRYRIYMLYLFSRQYKRSSNPVIMHLFKSKVWEYTTTLANQF